MATPFTSVPESTTRSSRPTPSTPVASGTATVGPFDAATSAWFGALCTGLGSADVTRAHQGTGDLAARKSAAAKVFQTAATAYRTMATTLADLGAPGIPIGENLQDALDGALPVAAEAATDGAAAIIAADDEASLDAAVDRGIDAVQTATAPLSAFSEAMAAPALVQQLEKLPACHDLFT